MSIQTQLNNQAISLLPRVSELIKKAEQHEKDQMTALALREILNSHTPVADMDEDGIEEFENWLIVEFAEKSLFKSTVHNIEFVHSDDCLSHDIEIDAISPTGWRQSFYVQVIDGEYRSDLGCWVTTNDSDGDINQEDYAEFNISDLIQRTEQFVSEQYPERHIRGNWYAIKDGDDFYAVEENSGFINSATSSYMRRFCQDTLSICDDLDEAIEYINEQF